MEGSNTAADDTDSVPGMESHGASYFKEGMAYLVFAEQMRCGYAQTMP